MQSNKYTEAFHSISHKLSKVPEIITQRSIYRVHTELRDVNNNAYEPYIVAIGPYHHGKDHLKMMEEHKARYLQLLLGSRQQSVERYISAINELEQEARDCYAEPISLNRAQFVEMLVLDGCFIIELVRKFYLGTPTGNTDPIFQRQWIRYGLVRDLILFENQIPFFVLRKLFYLIEGSDQPFVLMTYLLKFFANRGAFGSKLHSVLDRSIHFSWTPEEIKHLLNLVHNSWIYADNCGIYSANCGIYSANNIDLDGRGSSVPLKAGSNIIPPATELKDANVEFHAKQCDALFEVNFKNGIMEMPPLSFEDGTESLLRNLVVYEQYFLPGRPNFVTSYVILLDSLINTSKDVEILSKYNIIDNWLGDSEAVANIINRLADSVIFHRDSFIYAKMFDDVKRHSKKRRNRWMATLRRDVFYSPWGYISFFAALTILILTIAQAVCFILREVHK